MYYLVKGIILPNLALTRYHKTFEKFSYSILLLRVCTQDTPQCIPAGVSLGGNAHFSGILKYRSGVWANQT